MRRPRTWIAPSRGTTAGSGRGCRSRARATRREPALAVALKGWADPQCMRGRLVLTIRVDNGSSGGIASRARETSRRASADSAPLTPGPHTVEVEASEWFVPHRVAWNRDFRPLAWRMGEVELEAEDSACRPPRGPGA